MRDTSAPRILIRPPEAADEPTFLAAVRRSRSLHRPWVHPPATPEAYRAYLQRLGDPGFRACLLVRAETDALVGVVNLSQISLGNFRSAYLGYYAFSDEAGRGLMRLGLQSVVRQAFRELGLHRLEANIQPENGRSIALVQACGFKREGYSPRYLKIGGRWRDHERWAIVAD